MFMHVRPPPVTMPSEKMWLNACVDCRQRGNVLMYSVKTLTTPRVINPPSTSSLMDFPFSPGGLDATCAQSYSNMCRHRKWMDICRSPIRCQIQSQAVPEKLQEVKIL